MLSKIRWKRSDYITLGRAVSEFNKTVKKLQQEESSLILPDVIKYQDLKSDITTRKELNRMIKSLKRFQVPRQQEAIKTDGDVEITKWELTEIKRARTRATRRLSGELAGIEATSTLGTGNRRVNEIRATIKSFEKLEKATKEDFRRISRSILKQGVSDYEMKKASQFQKNFIVAYSKMGRKEIVEIAKNFRNPVDFWEYIKNSEFVDLELRYDVEEGIITVGEMSKDESYYYELEKLM